MWLSMYYFIMSQKAYQFDIDAELLNVSIKRIRLNSRILLNKKNRRKINL